MPGYPNLEDQFNELGIADIRMHDCFGIGDIDNGMWRDCQNNQWQLMANVPFDQQPRAKSFVAAITNMRSIYPATKQYMAEWDGSNLSDIFPRILAEANYAPTDAYLKTIVENPRRPDFRRNVLFRIGRTLDGGASVPVREVYARLAKELVYRYSYPNPELGTTQPLVMDWEIWNEPDLGIMFNSSQVEDYYRFYQAVAVEMKLANPAIRVGGPGTASGGDNPYTTGLLEYCRDNQVPLDFYSYHSYLATEDPTNLYQIARANRKRLSDHGHAQAKMIVSEWAPLYKADTNSQNKYQSAKGAAFTSAALIGLQMADVDMAYYYRGDGASLGIFNDDGEGEGGVSYAAQAFHLYNLMCSKTPLMLSNWDGWGQPDLNGCFFLAGASEDYQKVAILISTYRVEGNFFGNDNIGAPRGYPQHFVDSGRDVDSLIDPYSISAWFGGKAPNEMVEGALDCASLVDLGRGFGSGEYYGAYKSVAIGERVQISLPQLANAPSAPFGKLTRYVIQEGGSLLRLQPDDSINIGLIPDGNQFIATFDYQPNCVFYCLYEKEWGTEP